MSSYCPEDRALLSLWKPRFFGSGTCIVTDDSKRGPWLYVYGPASDDEGQWMRNRMTMCGELADYLNGGKRPTWLDDLERVSETRAVDLDGTGISAVGPMVDRNPPKLDWAQDDSEEAQDARRRLMNKLRPGGKSA